MAESPVDTTLIVECASRVVDSLTELKKITPENAAFLKSLAESGHEGLARAARLWNKPEHSEELRDSFHAVMRTELNKVFERIFESCSTSDGKRISKQDRVALGTERASLVYGEVTFESLAEVLYKKVDLPAGGVFYDLGSGTGRGVFAAAMVHNFQKCVGIEILQGLYEASEQVLTQYRQQVLPQYDSDEKKGQVIEFVRADFLEYDWSDADLVFANSTCFDEKLVSCIAAVAARLKKGTWFITLTKQLNSPHFRVVHSQQYRMSWGLATVNVHVKTTNPTFVPLPTEETSTGNVSAASTFTSP
eukprot:TRINITY_DN4343_c0_g1_i8.p1 TRINITY_DN4343_c0_g1~~TRINITY_DN4343_c0_g1_i8.p1  ORF type:complete len:305 (+),score=97.66 TRINITY_DN4343_c0_g1_i8:55-969(+)